MNLMEHWEQLEILICASWPWNDNIMSWTWAKDPENAFTWQNIVIWLGPHSGSFSKIEYFWN